MRAREASASLALQEFNVQRSTSSVGNRCSFILEIIFEAMDPSSRLKAVGRKRRHAPDSRRVHWANGSRLN